MSISKKIVLIDRLLDYGIGSRDSVTAIIMNCELGIDPLMRKMVANDDDI